MSICSCDASVGCFSARATQASQLQITSGQMSAPPSTYRISLVTVAASVLAVIEELLARDLVVFINCIGGDFFAGDALAGGFGGDVEGEVDDELIGVGAVEERAGHG